MFTSSTNSLVVPIQVDAWVVNDAVIQVSSDHSEQSIHRWTLDYSQLASFNSAAHQPFSNEDSQPSNGIYVQWTLPKGLRHATQPIDSTTCIPAGPMQFPLVPNRWLIVRYSGPSNQRIANAWIVESDFQANTTNVDDQGSPFPDPKDPGKKNWIGRCTPLANWAETAPIQPMSLTANMNGDIHFSVFQSYNKNVFSFQDSLSTLPDDSFSYSVIGWYSNPAQDILAQCQTLTDLQSQLNILKWTTPTMPLTALISQTLFQGMVCSVKCVNANSPRPVTPQDNASLSSIKLAVGANAMEALIALISTKDPTVVPQLLLEALASGLLDQLETNDANSTITDNLHTAEFAHQSGGIQWAISNLSAELASQLDALNEEQHLLEQQQAQLESLQWSLYALWWKSGNINATLSHLPNSPYGKAYKEALEKKYNQILSQLDSINTKIQPQQALVFASTASVQAQQTNLSAVLKKVNAPSMWHPKDPVVIIAGLPAATSAPEPGILPCRYLDQCAIGLEPSSMPMLNLRTLPSTIQSVQPLLVELFYVDTGQTNQLQNLPLYGLIPWAGQPYSPLFMEWQINWCKLPFSNWQFTDEHYQLSSPPSLTMEDAQLFCGISLLIPQASFAFKGQLKRLIDQDPTFKQAFSNNWEALEKAIDQWPIMAVSLSGLHQQMIQRDIRMNRIPLSSISPEALISQAVGNQAHHAPYPGPINSSSNSNFQPIRAGQFWFNQLSIVDRFGQAINLLQPYNTQQNNPGSNNVLTFQPYVSDRLKPQYPAIPYSSQSPVGFIQLNPRVIQPMRLKSDWLLANDDSNSKPIELNCQANPIAGWVLPNYLDQSFQCFSPEGQNLGELSVIEDMNGNKICSWQAAYGNPYSTIEAMQPTLPWVSDFLSSFVAADATKRVANPTQAFEALMDIIDLMLTSKLSGSSSYNACLSAVIGPIFAIARVAWQLELEQPPYQDQSWEQTCQPDAQTYQDYSFKIQLGSTERSQSGLLGYFEYDKGFNQFYSLYTPDSPSDYIQSTETNCFSLTPNSRGNTTPQLTTVLMDPFDKVYAYSDILPVQYLQLPSLFVQSALKNIAVTFRQGPLLTRESTIDLVLPSSIQGKWSWLDPQSEGSMQELATVPAKTNACFTGEPSYIRQGLLLFKPAACQQDPSHQYTQGTPR